MKEETKPYLLYVELLATSLLWSIAIYLILRGSGTVVDVDGFYHIQISDMMREKMAIIRNFEWATCSTWTNSFYDKDLLFHIYLAPFTLLGKVAGAKLATVTAVFFIALAMGFMLRCAGLKKHYFLAMMFILFASGPVFAGRLLLCRSILFSIFFMICGMICIFRGARWALLAVSFLYSLSYAGSWQIVPVVLIFDIVRMKIGGGELKVRNFLVFWAFMGIAAGTLVNPYFPDNIKGGFLQSVLVLKAKWLGTGSDQIIQASELSAMTMHKFLTGYLLVLSAFLYTSYKVLKEKKFVHEDWKLAGLFVLSIAYLVPTLMSMRFGEYFIPFSTSFLCVFWLSKTGFFEKEIRRLAVFLIVLILAMTSSFQLRKFLYSDHIRYCGAAEWMKKNLDAGEIVFTGDWDDAPPLFYTAPELRYLVFLEPYFMYSYSPEKYRLWKKITFGKMNSTALAIKAEFDSRAVFVPPDRPYLERKLELDPYAKLAYFGTEGETVFILDVPKDEIKEWNNAKNYFK